MLNLFDWKNCIDDFSQYSLVFNGLYRSSGVLGHLPKVRKYEKLLRNFNFEPSLKLRWCLALDFDGSQVPVTAGGFKLRTSYMQYN